MRTYVEILSWENKVQYLWVCYNRKKKQNFTHSMWLFFFLFSGCGAFVSNIKLKLQINFIKKAIFHGHCLFHQKTHYRCCFFLLSLCVSYAVVIACEHIKSIWTYFIAFNRKHGAKQSSYTFIATSPQLSLLLLLLIHKQY